MTTETSPPRKADLSTYVYEQIRQDIISLKIHPGEPLREITLADQFGVSRTPVRAAMRRLESEGFVTPDPIRGFAVTQISIEDVENAYQVIEVLEGLAARLAALRRNEAGIERIKEIARDLQKAAREEDLDSWMAADSTFHETIRELAQNPLINHLSLLPFSIIERIRHMHMRERRDSAMMAAVTSTHLKIVRAIEQGKADRAEALSRQLFREASELNLGLLRQWVLPLRRTF